MPQTELTQRLKAIREALGGITQQQLADAIGVGKSTISYIENGRSKPTYDQLNSLAMECGVNPAFLVSGSNPMFFGDYTSSVLNDPISPYGRKEGIPMVPVTLQYEGAIDYQLEKLPHVIIPGVKDPNARVFEVNGDSMYPVICSRDYVVCSRIDVGHLRDGELCVVISRNHGVLVQYVRILESGLRCYPANKEEHKPITISYADLVEIWEVQMRITRHVGGDHLTLDR